MKGYALKSALVLVLGALLLAHLTQPQAVVVDPPPKFKDKHDIMRWIIQQNGSCMNPPKKSKQG